MQSRTHGGRIGELLDICDRRTLNALMARAAVDPRREGRDISVDQFRRAAIRAGRPCRIGEAARVAAGLTPAEPLALMIA